jgi:two-component system response regulator FixJ
MNNIPGTVFIIDDDFSVRRSLSLFLMSQGYFVEIYASAEEYLEREPFDGTGCIILDIMMDGKSGLELQDELMKLDSNLPIIFITGQGNIHMSVQTLRKGALNFLEKPFKDDELLNSVSEAIELSQKIKADKEEIRAAKILINSLTPRESEVLTYLMTGLLNKQIASELNIAERTVKQHRHGISEKLGAKSVPEIIRIAGKAGILHFPLKKI